MNFVIGETYRLVQIENPEELVGRTIEIDPSTVFSYTFKVEQVTSTGELGKRKVIIFGGTYSRYGVATYDNKTGGMVPSGSNFKILE